MSRGSTPSGANQLARSQPSFEPKHGAARLQPLVERRDDARAAGLVFLEREGDGVVLAVGLERALPRPVAVAVQLGEAADVDDPEVHRRLAGHRPIGEHPPCPAARRDAEGVEAGADEEAAHLRRLAEDEIAVGGERLSGPLIICLMPAVSSAGMRASAASMCCSK